MMSKRAVTSDHLSDCALSTVCDAQRLVSQLHVCDGELGLSFHGGEPMELGFVIKRWIPKEDLKSALSRQARQEQVLCKLCPNAAHDNCYIDELRERITTGLAGIVRSCRLRLGRDQYDLDFSQIRLTARNGMVSRFVHRQEVVYWGNSRLGRLGRHAAQRAGVSRYGY